MRRIFSLLLVLSFLNSANAQKQITTKDTFDKIQAIVVPRANMLMIGQEYEAEVMLVNVNSKSRNPVFVGGRALPMKDGKGIYSVRASTEGVFNWSGVISVKENGKTNEYPFETEYQVFQGGANISADVMNVLYIGLDNPVSISVIGFSPQDLVVGITNGSLIKNDNRYSAKVYNKGQATISVAVKMKDGSTRMVGTRTYRIKEMPKPEPQFGVIESGSYSVEALMAQTNLRAVLSNFVFEGIKFNVTGYSVMFIPKTGATETLTETESAISENVKNVISKAKPGDRLILDKIIAEGPGGAIKLSPLVFDII